MRISKRLSLFLLTIFLISPAAPALAQKTSSASEEILFAVHLPPSLLGRGASDVWSDLMMFSAAVEKKYHLKISFVKTENPFKSVEALNKEKVSAAIILPYYYAREKHYKALNFSPIAIYQAAGKTSSSACIYGILPEGSTAEGMDALFGTRNTLALTGEHDWALLNMAFVNMNYAFEPHFFFSGFSINNSESAALSMLFDKSQSVVMNELMMKYMVKMDSRLGKASKIACAKPLPNIMIAAADDMPARRKEILLKILTTMDRDENFAFLKEYFTTTNGKWVPAGKEDFAPWEEMYDMTARLGWDKTFNVLPVK